VLRTFHRFSGILLHALFASSWASFRSRAALQLEIVALRHQLGVLHRSVKRPRLTAADRIFWAWLSQIWSDWRTALVIVKPETVIAWHRKGFRLFWTWKVLRGDPGRPAVAKDVRDLIRKMSRENPLWGAPRIHGELLKLGIEIGETSVSKYLVRVRKPPSQTWRTFLDNHINSLVYQPGRRHEYISDREGRTSRRVGYVLWLRSGGLRIHTVPDDAEAFQGNQPRSSKSKSLWNV
jgi:hypothetical protein